MKRTELFGCCLVFGVFLVVEKTHSQCSTVTETLEFQTTQSLNALDQFGSSVAITGDEAVVGAIEEGGFSGSAYVFSRNTGGAGNWGQLAKLNGLDSSIGDKFGTSVDLDSNLALIGANLHTLPGGTSAGAAYIFDGVTNWSQSAKLTASDAQPNDQFGTSVAISGNVAIVGAPLEDTNGTNAGAAYIFRFNGTTWVEEQKMAPVDVSVAAQFGFSVAISGDVVVVGALRDDLPGNNQAGSAYVFRFDGVSTWNQEAKLIATDADVNDEFGVSVAIDADAIVVGAHQQVSTCPGGLGGGNGGAAYVYRNQGGGGLESGSQAYRIGL